MRTILVRRLQMQKFRPIPGSHLSSVDFELHARFIMAIHVVQNLEKRAQAALVRPRVLSCRPVQNVEAVVRDVEILGRGERH